ncbi:M14 family zinc carboxypeptidase [Myroides sp. LJL116]
MEYQDIVKSYKDGKVEGRWITNEHIEDSLNDLKLYFKVEVIGYSQESLPIKKVTWGHGPVKIAMWSQMHGNESTTTKAVLDLLYFLNNSQDPIVHKWRSFFTLQIIVILNPDGARAYTRNNANQVDLNRDSILLSQKESKVLRNFLEDFNPHYAFNLHDQRSIFGVGDTGKNAIISFLAPAYDSELSLRENRILAMQLISCINHELQKDIKGHVGRFDDAFNINCIGDYCQSQNWITVLFEAGHYPKDYQREKSRAIVFKSLCIALNTIYKEEHLEKDIKEYLSIPENQKNFTDIIFANVLEQGSGEVFIVKAQYLEQFADKKVNFCPIVVDINKKGSKFAHLCEQERYVFRKEYIDKQEILNKNLEEVIRITPQKVNIILKK